MHSFISRLFSFLAVFIAVLRHIAWPTMYQYIKRLGFYRYYLLLPVIWPSFVAISTTHHHKKRTTECIHNAYIVYALSGTYTIIKEVKQFQIKLRKMRRQVAAMHIVGNVGNVCHLGFRYAENNYDHQHHVGYILKMALFSKTYD